MDNQFKIGSNLFDEADIFFEGAIKMPRVEDYFTCRDGDEKLHKTKMIRSSKEGIRWEIFIYDETIEE